MCTVDAFDRETMYFRDQYLFARGCIHVPILDLFVPNSDCWVSISGSGSGAQFFAVPKNRNGTLEPWNLLLGCKTGLVFLFLYLVSRVCYSFVHYITQILLR